MADNSLLKPDEAQLLKDVQTSGTNIIKDDAQIDMLVRGLINVGEVLFNAVIDVVKEDQKLCKAIRNRMEDISRELIASNNKLTEEEIETCKENSAAIRAFLLTPGTSDEMIKTCFIELREWHQRMQEAQIRNERANESVLKRAQETDEQILAHSNNNKKTVTTVAAVAGGVVGAAGLAGLIYGIISYFGNSGKRA